MAHLVWDWNGTLLDDLALVVEATNESLATVGRLRVTSESTRRDFRRPVIDYYAYVLGRPVTAAEFHALDEKFHAAYRARQDNCPLAADALDAIIAWPGTQSVLSMLRHTDLVPAVARHGLLAHLLRVDGLRDLADAGGNKAPHLRAHLAVLGLDPAECVLIGDSVDDAVAAAEVGAGVVLYEGGFTSAEKLRATGMPTAATLLDAIALAQAGAAPGTAAGAANAGSAGRAVR